MSDYLNEIRHIREGGEPAPPPRPPGANRILQGGRTASHIGTEIMKLGWNLLVVAVSLAFIALCVLIAISIAGS